MPTAAAITSMTTIPIEALLLIAFLEKEVDTFILETMRLSEFI